MWSLVVDVYGMKVTNCLVRDGLNWGEQPLLNDEGCPVDDEIMGPFEYSHNKTRATVSFQAHKFPYTSSVYYQCNVRLCLKDSGGCEDVVRIHPFHLLMIFRNKKFTSSITLLLTPSCINIDRVMIYTVRWWGVFLRFTCWLALHIHDT